MKKRSNKILAIIGAALIISLAIVIGFWVGGAFDKADGSSATEGDWTSDVLLPVD